MISDYLKNQKAWSEKTFGPGKRTIGLSKHIQKELAEVQEDPDDRTEWIDIIILALDGYWRAGGSEDTIVYDLRRKQQINFNRKYPYPTSQDDPSEHIS